MNDRNQLFKDVDINDYHVMTHSSKKLKTDRQMTDATRSAVAILVDR
jgi:hypothetical protein